jgi:hypothetical protein
MRQYPSYPQPNRAGTTQEHAANPTYIERVDQTLTSQLPTIREFSAEWLESKRRVQQITVARTTRRAQSPGHPFREATPGDQN